LLGCSRSGRRCHCTGAEPRQNGYPSSKNPSHPAPIRHPGCQTLSAHTHATALAPHGRPSAPDPVNTASHRAPLPPPTPLPANCSSVHIHSAIPPHNRDCVLVPRSAQINPRSPHALAPTLPSILISSSSSSLRRTCLSFPSLSLSYNCSTNLLMPL